MYPVRLKREPLKGQKSHSESSFFLAPARVLTLPCPQARRIHPPPLSRIVPTALTHRLARYSSRSSRSDGSIEDETLDPSLSEPDQSASTSTSHQSAPSTPQSAAAYLLAQAEREEMEEEEMKVPRSVEMQLQEPAWDGDEPQARAIRRILADQYKPLRVKGHKKKIPVPPPLPSILFRDPPRPPPSSDSSSTEPKNPWDFTFRAPASHQPLVRTGSSLPPVKGPSGKNVPRGIRVASAYEKMLDYSAGIGVGGGAAVLVPVEEGEEESHQPQERVPMGDMRAWNGFVEDRIEEARRKGLFNNIKGRGKPLEKDEAESNPFIKRDEFLINRIIHSQGAAPPWVELQGEMETNLSVFRTELRQAWSRRAIRMMSLGGVTRTAIHQIREGWNDPEWEARERTYHEASVRVLNSSVRRYNTIAPYSVRKTPLSLQVELRKCYRDCAKHIEKELLKRLAGENGSTIKMRTKEDKEIIGEVADEEIPAVKESMWRGFRRLVKELVGTSEQRSQESSLKN